MRRRDFVNGIGCAGAALTAGSRILVSSHRAQAAASSRQRNLATALSEIGATIGLRVTRFEHSQIVDSRDVAFPLGTGAAQLILDRTTISCHTRTSPVRDRPDATDIEIAFRVARGRLPNATVAFRLSMGKWSRDVYLMIPGAVYAGNRFASRHIPFPPLLSEPSDIGPHVPTIISDVPRLNNQQGDSKIALAAVDAAVPSIGVRLPGAEPDQGFGLLLLADPFTSIGQSSILVEENPDRSAATLTVAAPSVRPGVRYATCNTRLASTDRGADLDLGAMVAMRLRLIAFACPDIPSLFNRWFEARRDRVGPVKLRHNLPLSFGRQLIEDRLLLDQWTDSPGFFSTRSPTVLPIPAPATARNESTFRTGADGALALVLPLLATGAAGARAHAAAVLDFQFQGQTSCGFFHAASDGHVWWDEGDSPPTETGAAIVDAKSARPRRWSHIGRNAEALHLVCKQLLLLQTIDPSSSVPDTWRAGVVRVADAFVRLWTKHKQLGQYISNDTGDVVVGGSTAGALAPAGLALAARILNSENYQRAAVAIADAYYTQFVRNGVTCGGAPSALQCPDSRSAAALLESFVTLAETTGDGIWFARAAEVAHQLATWIVAWDVPLPENSTLGKMGARTTGAMLVSAQDKWALPGFAGLSGDALFRLYRATGRGVYLELLREMVHNGTGYIDPEDRRPDVDTKPGWVAGRIPISDASGSPGDVTVTTPAGTAQATCLLSAAEIPSLYVQPDTGFLFVFDHVEAHVEERTKTHIVLSVRNPTRFEAQLRIYSELDATRTQVLPPFPLWSARSLTLSAGASESIEIAVPS